MLQMTERHNVFGLVGHLQNIGVRVVCIHPARGRLFVIIIKIIICIISQALFLFVFISASWAF